MASLDKTDEEVRTYSLGSDNYADTPPMHAPRPDYMLKPHLPTIPDYDAYDYIAPKRSGEICVMSSRDRVTCMIRDMTVIIPDRLVLTDWDNISVKLVDANSKTIISQLSLGTEDADRPWGITATTSTQVAVTVPGRQHITFFPVSSELGKGHTIQADGECHGICCHQDILVVTYCSPPKIGILDIKGNVLTTMTAGGLYQPKYVQANSRSVYISEEGIKLNWQGEVTGRFRSVRDPIPRGLALLRDGSLLVCEYGRNSMCQVAADGNNSRIVLPCIRCPDTLCVDEVAHKLYVSRWRHSEIELNNYILVYNI